MKKINLIWDYDIESPSGSWVIDRERYDLSIAIDRMANSDYLIIYESRAIIPDFYDAVLINPIRWKKIFTHDLSICDGKKIIHIPPFTPTWICESDYDIYKKSKLVSMIASDKMMCDGHFYRDRVAKEFPYTDHLYGKGRRNELVNKIDGLKDYMFSVAIENAKYDTYFTEKILDCFLTGTIPVYWGTDRIDTYFDPKGIINLESIRISDLNERMYNERKDSVIRNFEIAKNLKLTSGHMIDHILNIIYGG